jgi:serine/threonine protein kinase
MRTEEHQVDEQWEQSGLIGKLLGDKYMVVRELSHSPRSDVFEAELLERGQRLAVKVLHAAHAASNALRGYIDEHRSVALIGHPNIVDVIDIGRHATGEPFVACELVRGETLRALIEVRPLEQRRALQIMRQVVEALRAAHELGITHRDLSPAQLMIARGERDADHVKVLGFGLARLVTAGAETFADPDYIAPEYVLGKRADRRADLYSAGAILFELLTGHAPFHAKGAQALMRLHAYAPVQTLKQRAPDKTFTPETEALVERALEKRPEDRFQTASEMLDAIDRAIESVAAVEASLAMTSPIASNDPKPDGELLLLARDLMPRGSAPSLAEPIIPQNVARVVPELPWWMRAAKVVRRASAIARRLAARGWAAFRRLDHRVQMGLGGATLLVVTILIVMIARGGNDAPRATSAAAAQPASEIDEDTEAAGEPIDDVASWSRELEQSRSCSERRELIAKLATAGDPRAIPSLRKARASKCVAREASKAIAKLERATKKK